MYLQHFKLTELPFSITPDTSFFMNRAGYQDALNVLTIALRSGEGFVKVTGAVGVGKTILCRKLMKCVSKEFVTAYIHNPYIKPDSLLFAIADALSVKYTEGISQHVLMKSITLALLNTHRNGKKVVVCLDEVQAMPVQTLESLRLKLMAGLDISEKRLPQDGRFSLKIKEHSIDVRLSTMPVQYGESVVMRLLDQTGGTLDLSAIGMPKALLDRFEKLIQRPHGMMVCQ